jgi:transcriptional regulator with XRE-family HTH domain
MATKTVSPILLLTGLDGLAQSSATMNGKQRCRSSLDERMTRPEVGRQIGHRILTLRRRRSWSQAKLAARLEIARDRLSKWERGTSTPPAEALIDLSAVLGVSLDELIAGRTPAAPAPSITDERLGEARAYLGALVEALKAR